MSRPKGTNIYGKRAVECINHQCFLKGCRLKDELERLNIPKETFSWWARGVCNPTAPALEAMARAGHDIYFILTGEKDHGQA